MQAQEELRRVYMELGSSELQSRIRDDRTQTEAEVQRLTTERDALRDRLRVCVCLRHGVDGFELTNSC